MADVAVEIAGTSYRLACEDGQEAHLMALAREIDVEARRLMQRMTRPPEEARLMLMVALVMADRACEAEATTAAPGASSEAAASLDSLAERIERISGDLSPG